MDFGHPARRRWGEDGAVSSRAVAEGADTFTYAYLANSDLVNTLSGPANMVQTRAYESTRDLVDYVENRVGATTVSKYDYTNDTIGRRTGVQKSGTAFTTTDTIAWGYDDRSQVTSAVAATDAKYDYTYAYDPIGNRTSYVTKETGTPVTTGYTANRLNQYTAITNRTDPAYDDDGNMTILPAAAGDWTLAWNGENRLASAESSSARLEFLYDYMGRRVGKKTYTGTTGNWALSETRRFLYDGWNLIAEFVVEGAAISLDRTHLWGLDLSGSLQGAGGVGGLLRTSEHDVAVAAYYPSYDANGNVSEYLDSTAATVAHYEYSPFGRTTAATGAKAATMPFRFSTRHLDVTTDLVYYGHRYCSPVLGRWTSRDPLGESAFLNAFVWRIEGDLYSHFTLLFDHQFTITPYRFLDNNPVGEVDIHGLFGLDTINRWKACKSIKKLAKECLDGMNKTDRAKLEVFVTRIMNGKLTEQYDQNYACARAWAEDYFAKHHEGEWHAGMITARAHKMAYNMLVTRYAGYWQNLATAGKAVKACKDLTGAVVSCFRPSP